MGYYASYYKCALQVNPYSYAKYRGEDTENEEEYNNQILIKCRKNGIKIVGLADHGSVDSTESLRKILQENDIVVFPGFEIASAEKIHMVCLFSPEKNVSELNRILGSLGLPIDGKETDPSSKSCIEIAKIVREMGGFWYAAHITSDNGILKIGQMQQVWKNPLLLAAQIPASKDEIDPKYSNIIRNKDPEYRREQMLALINAKDIEKPKDLDLDAASTLIKMTEPSFDNFMMAFRDSESRIRLNYEVESSYQSCIEQIEVFGGYLDGLKIEFSDNLTTLIGGRGTGKSTIVNLIRYALDIEIEEKKAFDSMLAANLSSQGRVELVVSSNKQYGKKFKVIRRYKQEPVVENMDGKVSELKSSDLLPSVEIYGQNEIMRTVDDQEKIEKIVKRLFTADHSIEQKLESAFTNLRKNGKELVIIENKIEDVNDMVSDLPAIKERLKYFVDAGIDTKLAVVKRLSLEETQFENYCINMPDSNLNLSILNVIETENNELKECGYAITQYNRTLEQIEAIYESAVGKLKNTFNEQKSKWSEERQKYDDEIKEALKGIDEIQDKSSTEIVEEYSELIKKVEKAEPVQNQMNILEEKKKNLLLERKNLIEECRKCWDESDSHDEKQIKRLNKKRLNGKVRISIKYRQQKSELIKILTNLDRVTEKSLKGLLEYEDFDTFTFAEDIRNGADTLCSKYSFTSTIAEKIVTGLSEKKIRMIEEMQLRNIYLIDLEVGGTFRSIYKLSKGQQCTAILNILLLENKDPLIVDQPEDNLDNSFIAENLIELIRANKIKRQYIFATHNANIPVFGDAELIVAMEEKDGTGRVCENGIGSIDAVGVKEKVVKILEGGKDAFKMREKKYNM